MSSERRTRRFGYAVGAALITIGAVAAITLVVVSLVRVMSKVPTSDHSFGNNQTTTVHVDAGGSKSIYYIYYTNSPAPPPTSIRCTVRPQPTYLRGQDLNFIPTSHFTVWRARFYFKVAHGGDYTVSCSGPSDARYGVGEYVSANELMDLFWGIGAGVVLVIVGIGTFFVTMVRRARANRARANLPPPPMQYPQQ